MRPATDHTVAFRTASRTGALPCSSPQNASPTVASQETSTDKKQEGNPLLGCGCLLVILLLIGGLAASCLGGSDEPSDQALPTAAPPTTTSAAPPTTSTAPTTTYSVPAPAQPIADRDCADFSSQAEAQAALLPGDPEHLDPDNDGVACENHTYGSDYSSPDTYVPAPRAPADDDSSSGGTRPRSGNSGHPCLPGERDGDNDGYCGEGR